MVYTLIMNKISVQENFYRISIKALVLNEEKKFLLIKESDNRWELPGGGLDFGETPQEGLRREIKEEMGIKVTEISDRPAYFYTDKHHRHGYISNVLYQAKLENLDFTPSDECVEVRFFTKKEALQENLFSNVKKFLTVFDEKNH